MEEEPGVLLPLVHAELEMIHLLQGFNFSCRRVNYKVTQTKSILPTISAVKGLYFVTYLPEENTANINL